ncbi:arylsulfatase [Singulisphaera sp. GP187]|uniref:arylsulfatase n=1 Tax=Singulisphaera sp. GP187 TaxID=1882752 RepID=UPI00092B72B3|nr:arylsulfatase [Singulisphaera sp. GP187]SIO57121.1 arylsulfatase [Singulisphaera sp. GP187]
MKRQWFVRPHLSLALTALACLAGLGAAHAKAPTASPPNVVIFLADDLGFSDVGCYGGEIETPNLDRLAANGLRFTQFYNTARCWPSRAALLSGYYPQQVNRDPAARRPRWAALLPELLKPAGYCSYHSGKWHVDGPVLAARFERSYLVVDQDRFFSPKNHQLDDRPLPQPRPEDGYYATRAIASHAVSWLSDHEANHRGEPFFLYVGFTSPHFPIQALPEDIARYRDRYLAGWDVVRKERWERIRKLGIAGGELPSPEPDVFGRSNLSEDALRTRISPGEVRYAAPWETLSEEQKRFQATKMAIHAAMVDRMDREVGRVVKQLETAGVLDNTLILFLSDNGASQEQIIRGDGHDPSAPLGSAKSYLGIGPGWSTLANTPFRMHKIWNHEGGISTLLIAHWPAGIQAKGELRHTPGHLVDIVPTLLELAKTPAPESFHGENRPPLPGKSLVPALANDITIEREFLFFKHQGNRALRAGDWKIVSRGPDGDWELYDLAKDRAESHDLATKNPEKLKALVAIWDRQDKEYRAQGATGLPLESPNAPAKRPKTGTKP